MAGMLLVLAASSALAYGDAGLRVGDDAVFAGKVDAAVYDAAQDLIWFRSAGQLEVVDLRASPPSVTVIAKKLPSDGAFDITGVSQAGWATAPGQWVLAYPRFAIGKKVKVTVVAGTDDDENGDREPAIRRAIKKIKVVVGKKWLAAFATRAPHAVPPAVKPVAEKGMAKWCADNAHGIAGCGDARPVGTAGYEIVVVNDAGEDGYAWPLCGLWSSREHALAALDGSTDWKENSPGTTATGCDSALPEPGGERYAVNDQICTPGPRVACDQAQGWTYFGWAPGAADAATPSVITDLQALRDQACACTDSACKQAVLGKVRQLAQDHANDKGTADEAKQVDDLASAIGKCVGIQ